jgi:hypothetical protein
MPEKLTVTATTRAADVRLVVEVDYSPGCPSSSDDPGEDPYLELLYVWPEDAEQTPENCIYGTLSSEEQEAVQRAAEDARESGADSAAEDAAADGWFERMGA